MAESGGWSEHISTPDSMLGSFVYRQEGIRVGKKKNLRNPEDVCSSVCAGAEMCVWEDECVFSMTCLCGSQSLLCHFLHILA